MIDRVEEFQPATLEIAESGEPVLTVSGDLAANDLIEVRLENEAVAVISDGKLLGQSHHLTNTLQNWLVLAEEVAVRAANCESVFDTVVYAPVYNYNPNSQRRI